MNVQPPGLEAKALVRRGERAHRISQAIGDLNFERMLEVEAPVHVVESVINGA